MRMQNKSLSSDPPPMLSLSTQYHKLLDELPPDVSNAYTFAIAHRTEMVIDTWFADRFDRSTISDPYVANGKPTFYNKDKFVGEFAKDFTMIVSNVENEDNWVANDAAGMTADTVKLTGLASFLTSALGGELPPIPQGDAAAPAAGLKEMKMGFGPGANGEMEEVGAEKKPRRKKKAKAPKSEL